MTSTLTKRLLGACVLVAATLVLTSLLPSPHSLPPRNPAVKRVTYDLRQPAPVEKPAQPATAASPEVTTTIPTAPVQPEPAPKAAPEHAAKSISTGTAPEPPAAAPVHKSAGERRWYVQIGIYVKLANARHSVERLKAAGIRARLDEVAFKGGTRHRVRCGPLATEAQALRLRQSVAKVGFNDARVAREAD